MSEIKTLARGAITIIDYNDAASISSLIESNKPLTIIFADSNRSSEWSAVSPLILSPTIFVSSTSSANDNQAQNLTSLSWYFQQSGGSTDIWKEITFNESGQGNLIDGNNHGFSMVMSGQDKYQLTVACDQDGRVSLLDEAHTQVSFKYVGVYTDLNGMATRVTATIPYSMIKSGTDKSASIIYAPDGNIFIKSGTGGTEDKSAVIELWKGSTPDFSHVDFRWYLQKDGVFNPMVLSTVTQISGTTITLNSASWDSSVEVGSKFRFQDTAYEWTQENPKLLDDVYVVTAVNAVNHQLEVRLASDTTKGLKQAYAAGSRIVSNWWDYRTGSNWARIKATSPGEAVTEGLSTDGTTGFYLGDLDTSSLPAGQTAGPECTGSNVLIVPAVSVYGIETIKGVAYDMDPVMTGGKPYVARPQMINFLDYTDPYQITLISSQGNMIRNGLGYLKVDTEIRQGGELLSTSEKDSLYYDWAIYDSNGDRKTGNELTPEFYHGNSADKGAVRGYGRNTYVVANKPADADGVQIDVVPKFDTVYISKFDLTGKGTVTCEISIR